MRFRIARRNEFLQIAASALGQGLDPDGEEDSAARDSFQRAVACESRGVFSPYGEHQLSADGGAFHDAAAGHDRTLLSGHISDVGDGSSAVSRFDVLYFQFLSGGAA